MNALNLSKLIGEEQIKNKVKEIGTALTDKYKDKEVVAICVLNGSFVFFSDLIREIDTEVKCEFLGLSSYANSMQSSGEVKVTLDLSAAIEGKHVLLVEDIVDTGLTMNYLQRNLLSRNPASLCTVCLLHKPSAMKVKCQIDHVGFEIGNDFVVGYGLDYGGHYRNLPYVAQVSTLN